MKKIVLLFLSWPLVSGGYLMSMSGESIESSKKDAVVCADEKTLAELCNTAAHDGAGLIALRMQELSLMDDVQKKAGVEEAKKKDMASASH